MPSFSEEEREKPRGGMQHTNTVEKRIGICGLWGLIMETPEPVWQFRI